MSRYREAALAALRAEVERRGAADTSRRPWDPTPLLSPQQRARYEDTARFQSWPAGRRSGKTNLAEKLLLKVARERRGQQAFYVSTSIKRAVATIWDELVLMNADLALGGRPNLVNHTLAFSGGGKLTVTGAEDKTMANDLRGRPKVALWILDECQDWKDELLRYFYESVVFPSLADVRGSVILAGTGGAPRGFWHEAATALPEWSRHPQWTPLDNPFLAEGEAANLIAKACADRGVGIEDASIQREFFAVFVADLARQIFPVSESNKFSRGVWDPSLGWWVGGDTPDAPPQDWSVILGNDFGTVDKAAWVAIGWVARDPRLWILETDAQPALGSGAQVAQVNESAKKYGNVGNIYVVGDPGGGGKSHIVTLRQEHWLPIEAAEKTQKAAACIVMRSGLRSTKLMVAREEAAFIEELGQPEWDPDAIGQVIKGHMPDRVDGCLYGYRKAVGLHHWAPPVQPLTQEQRWAAADLAAQEEEDRALRDLGLQ